MEIFMEFFKGIRMEIWVIIIMGFLWEFLWDFLFVFLWEFK